MVSKYECINIPDDDDGDMDEEFEPKHNANMIISKAVGGDYIGDEDSSGFYEGLSRRNHLYWNVDATKTLIRLRGEREAEFCDSTVRKSRLWEEICQSMRELGYDFSVEKVSKKWHNIMITYNKNTLKKLRTGSVNWDFYDDIDVYYKDKRTQMIYDDMYLNDSKIAMPEVAYQQSPPMLAAAQQAISGLPAITIKRRNPSNGSQPQPPSTNGQSVDESRFFDQKKIVQSFANDSNNFTNGSSIPGDYEEADDLDETDELDSKRMRFNLDTEFPPMASEDLESMWWKDYFEKRLELDRERMRRQHDRHKELVSMQKAALMMNQKAEKAKVDAIIHLTDAINRMIDAKQRTNSS